VISGLLHTQQVLNGKRVCNAQHRAPAQQTLMFYREAHTGAISYLQSTRSNLIKHKARNIDLTCSGRFSIHLVCPGVTFLCSVSNVSLVSRFSTERYVPARGVHPRVGRPSICATMRRINSEYFEADGLTTCCEIKYSFVLSIPNFLTTVSERSTKQFDITYNVAFLLASTIAMIKDGVLQLC
jgi:hypothetical protein